MLNIYIFTTSYSQKRIKNTKEEAISVFMLLHKARKRKERTLLGLSFAALAYTLVYVIYSYVIRYETTQSPTDEKRINVNLEDPTSMRHSSSPQDQKISLPKCKLYALIDGFKAAKGYLATFGSGNPYVPNCSTQAISSSLDCDHFYFKPPCYSADQTKWTEPEFILLDGSDRRNSSCGLLAGALDFGVIIPNKLAFVFVADHASWEIDSVRHHLAPYILRVRDERNRSRIVMTFHLAYPTMLADPAAAATTLAETVRCIRDHLSLWYDGSTVERLFGGAHGSVIVSERRVSALRLHAFLSALEAVRLGQDPVEAVAHVNLPDFIGQVRKSKSSKIATEVIPLPHRPVLAASSFMPIIKTVSGISDEELIGDSIVKYSARWAQLGGGRTYLRQYAPKLLQGTEFESFHFDANNERRVVGIANYSSRLISTSPSNAARQFSPYVSVVLSGFRMFTPTALLSLQMHVQPISARTYLWSFLGKLHNDFRKLMVEKFQHWSSEKAQLALTNGSTASFCCASRNLVTESPQAIYSKSIFVPIGRGQLSLDCYRIYEAALCGAIPVISGAHYAEEFWHTFAHYATSRGRLPPFVFAHSWDAAVVELDRLLAAPEELSRMQGDCVRWVFDNFRFLQKSYLGV